MYYRLIFVSRVKGIALARGPGARSPPELLHAESGVMYYRLIFASRVKGIALARGPGGA